MIPNRKEYSLPVIYCWTNKINGKQYIGSSVNCFKRYSEYSGGYDRPRSKDYNRIICRSMRKHGFYNFEFEIIESVSDLNVLEQRETFWIQSKKTFDPNVGYNLTAVARGTLKGFCSAQTRDKLRKSGQRLSRETSERQSIPVYQIDKISKHIIRCFASAKEASNILMIKFGNHQIGECCKLKRYSALGFFWRYKDQVDQYGFIERPDFRSIRLMESSNRSKPVVQMDMNDNIIRYWHGSSSVKLSLGYSIASISACCTGKAKTAYGYKWSFVTEKQKLDEIKLEIRKKGLEKQTVALSYYNKSPI